jgi:hypothetical protein
MDRPIIKHMKVASFGFHLLLLCLSACIVHVIWTNISEILEFENSNISDPLERAMLQTMAHYSRNQVIFKIFLYVLVLATIVLFWTKKNKSTFMIFNSVAIPLLISKCNFILWNVFAARFDSPFIDVRDVTIVIAIGLFYPVFSRFNGYSSQRIIFRLKDVSFQIAGILIFCLLESFVLQWPR